MSGEQSLFDKTRNASYAQKQPTLSGQRLQLANVYAAAGSYGLTLAEAAGKVADGHSSRICQAMKDLRDSGHLIPTDRRRKVEGGRLSVVLVAARYA